MKQGSLSGKQSAMYERVLVAIDHSDASERAQAAAREPARLADQPVLVVW